MLELIEVFSPTQILACIVGLILATKGGWDIIDFFKNKYSEKFNSDYEKKTKEQKLEDHYKKCSALQNTITEDLNSCWLCNEVLFLNQTVLLPDQREHS